MAALVGCGLAHVPHNRAALERLGDEGGIDDRRRPGGNERKGEDCEQPDDGKATAHGPFSRHCHRKYTEIATPIHSISPWVRMLTRPSGRVR